MSGAPHQPQVTELKVWYSTNDGKTWVPSDVDESDAGEFDVTVDHPALSHTNQFVWLRSRHRPTKAALTRPSNVPIA